MLKETMMNVRYQFPHKLPTFVHLATLLPLLALSACRSTASKPHVLLEKADLQPYKISSAEYSVILRDTEAALRQSVSNVTQQKAQQHAARTYGWLSYKKDLAATQTKVYALRLKFDEVQQRYEAVYSAAGIIDGPETHTFDGIGYCALARDIAGTVSWEPVKNQPCFSEKCSSHVTAQITKATCRALNDRVLQPRRV